MTAVCKYAGRGAFQGPCICVRIVCSHVKQLTTFHTLSILAVGTFSSQSCVCMHELSVAVLCVCKIGGYAGRYQNAPQAGHPGGSEDCVTEWNPCVAGVCSNVETDVRVCVQSVAMLRNITSFHNLATQAVERTASGGLRVTRSPARSLRTLQMARKLSSKRQSCTFVELHVWKWQGHCQVSNHNAHNLCFLLVALLWYAGPSVKRCMMSFTRSSEHSRRNTGDC